MVNRASNIAMTDQLIDGINLKWKLTVNYRDSAGTLKTREREFTKTGFYNAVNVGGNVINLNPRFTGATPPRLESGYGLPYWYRGDRKTEDETVLIDVYQP
jgi:hypothetical protein